MRKADYNLLAQLIKVLVAVDSETARQITQLARVFANNASVNKTEFLKACGLK